ncbi:TPA: S9 family peptidase, partial [Vibrio parahaemolyticus]|nr:S9 family peptidase [Vibrio parahaemolyticus]HCE4678147.1 S9 family peptidase [Vibrio parahaemolyticus]
MKKNTLALATALALGSVLSVAHANEAAQSSVEQVTPKAITYPTTQKVNVVDDYFGTKVSDPYRWLEDDLSPETAEWVKAQNAVTFDYLSKIPYREQIEERITKLMDYEKQSQPFKEGKFTYFYKNDGLQNQDVLYRQLGDGDAEMFLDPNTFSE